MDNSYFHHNIILQNQLKVKMRIIVLLSPIHFSPFFHSFFLWILIYKSKTIFSIQREIIITSHFRKLAKVSTNNFKIDIHGISDLLEMCKNIISAWILICQSIRNFIPCCRKSGSRNITQILPQNRNFSSLHSLYTVLRLCVSFGPLYLKVAI